jgi:glycosyltransferase involved in cell wall biosynthesis
MRIVLLSTSMGMGGADQQLLFAAREMRARGHEILIVSLTSLGPMGLEARRSGIRTESLEMRRGCPDPRGLLRLIRLVRTWKPDVVHSHMVHANLMARALRPFAPAPVLISTIHNIYEGGSLRMTAYRLTNFLVDQMTIVSQAAAERFISEGIVPRELLRVIPNGVDMARFRSVSPTARESMRRSLGLQGKFLWMAVGRFEISKDYGTMLRAFALVRRHHADTALLLVGRGSLQPEIEVLVNSLSLGGDVRFLGIREDVPDLMPAADGYVMSSAWEGMPTVLLEAAAAGLPIVATEVGGNSEVVWRGKSGLLVPRRNPDALARAMTTLMELPEAQRRAMGELGRERVGAQFALGRMVERWESLYAEVLARKGRFRPPSAA